MARSRPGHTCTALYLPEALTLEIKLAAVAAGRSLPELLAELVTRGWEEREYGTPKHPTPREYSTPTLETPRTPVPPPGSTVPPRELAPVVRLEGAKVCDQCQGRFTPAPKATRSRFCSTRCHDAHHPAERKKKRLGLQETSAGR